MKIFFYSALPSMQFVDVIPPRSENGVSSPLGGAMFQISWKTRCVPEKCNRKQNCSSKP